MTLEKEIEIKKVRCPILNNPRVSGAYIESGYGVSLVGVEAVVKYEGEEPKEISCMQYNSEKKKCGYNEKPCIYSKFEKF